MSPEHKSRKDNEDVVAVRVSPYITGTTPNPHNSTTGKPNETSNDDDKRAVSVTEWEGPACKDETGLSEAKTIDSNVRLSSLVDVYDSTVYGIPTSKRLRARS